MQDLSRVVGGGVEICWALVMFMDGSHHCSLRPCDVSLGGRYLLLQQRQETERQNACVTRKFLKPDRPLPLAFARLDACESAWRRIVMGFLMSREFNHDLRGREKNDTISRPE